MDRNGQLASGSCDETHSFVVVTELAHIDSVAPVLIFQPHIVRLSRRQNRRHRRPNTLDHLTVAGRLNERTGRDPNGVLTVGAVTVRLRRQKQSREQDHPDSGREHGDRHASAHVAGGCLSQQHSRPDQKRDRQQDQSTEAQLMPGVADGRDT